MLIRIFAFFVLIFAADAVNIKDIIATYPTLRKCIPTFKMFDATGKLPSGLSSGNFFDMGNFDQCLNIEKTNNISEVIKGKYCLMKLALPIDKENIASLLEMFENTFSELYDPEHTQEEEVPKVQERLVMEEIDSLVNSPGLILGWCLPHTCPINELSTVLSSALQIIDPGMKVVPIMGGVCQTKDDLKNDYNTGNIIIITFLAITLFLMVISTLYDMFIQHYKKKPAHIILIAFSVKTNGQKLLSISNNPDQLPCLNGIRFLSMMWVVYGHRFAGNLLRPNGNLFTIKDWVQRPINMYILKAPVSVDTFFVLSGTLLGYSYCLARNKGVKFNIILFYLHRYLRLTPVLAVVIWVHATIIGFFGSGPFWPFTQMSVQTLCADYWWRPLIYVQNYFKMEEICLGQTWYLAVDMQLFILSPIILIPLWKWPKQTLLASGVLVLGSMASSFAVLYINDLAGFSIDFADYVNFMEKYYVATHTRYGPWLMGLMLGYYLFKLKKNRANRKSLHPALVALGWIVGMGLLLSMLFAGHDLMLHRTKLGSHFFNSFHRYGWALGLCWVIYACTQGYGGPVNTFLSWSLFQILGRFTYTIYLVHFSVIFMMIGSSRTSSYFSDFSTMYIFWGDLMMSLAISVCLTLAYESPMIMIEKVLFKTGHKKKQDLPLHKNPSTSKDGQINHGFEGDYNK